MDPVQPAAPTISDRPHRRPLSAARGTTVDPVSHRFGRCGAAWAPTAGRASQEA